MSATAIDYEDVRKLIVEPHVKWIAEQFVAKTGANARVEQTGDNFEVVVTDREQIEKEFGTFDVKPSAWVYHGIFDIGGRIQ